MEVKNIFNQRSGVSLPFSDVCQPVITGKIVPSKIVEMIIDHAKKIGWNYIDFHGGEKLFGSAIPSTSWNRERIIQIIDTMVMYVRNSR